MKKALLKICVAASVSVSANVFAQMPVIDGANLAQQVQQVASWGKQFVQMKAQLDQLNQTYRSLNGVRGMAQLINNPALRKYLPSDYQTIVNGGYGSTAAIRSKFKLFGIDQTKLSSNSDVAKAFERNATLAAANQATGEAAYRAASQRFDDIQVLLDKVNDTPDQKDILELQGRIMAEQVMLQNEAIKLQMMAQLRETQKELSAQQAAEIRMKSVKGEIPRF